jgi:hypothetical protein
LANSKVRMPPASMSKPVIERPVPHVKLFMITRRGGPLPPAG